MATVSSFTCTPDPVPSGQSGEIAVAFTLDPGTPDETATLTLTLDGGQQGSATVTLHGKPAESTPTVSVGSSGAGWEIQTTAGTLAAGPSENTFTITY